MSENGKSQVTTTQPSCGSARGNHYITMAHSNKFNPRHDSRRSCKIYWLVLRPFKRSSNSFMPFYAQVRKPLLPLQDECASSFLVQANKYPHLVWAPKGCRVTLFRKQCHAVVTYVICSCTFLSATRLQTTKLTRLSCNRQQEPGPLRRAGYRTTNPAGVSGTHRSNLSQIRMEAPAGPHEEVVIPQGCSGLPFPC